MNAARNIVPASSRHRVRIGFFPGLYARNQWTYRTGTVIDQPDADLAATNLVSVQLDGGEDAQVIAVPPFVLMQL